MLEHHRHKAIHDQKNRFEFLQQGNKPEKQGNKNTVIFEFFSLHNLEHNEEPVERARFTVLMWGFALNLAIFSTCLLVSILTNQGFASMLPFISSIGINGFMIYLLVKKGWVKALTHVIIFLGLIPIWANFLELKDIGVTLVCLEIFIQILIYAFFNLNNRWAFFYFLVSAIPFLLVTLDNPRTPFITRIRSQPFGNLVFTINSAYTTLFLAFIIYQVISTFQQSILRLRKKTAELQEKTIEVQGKSRELAVQAAELQEQSDLLQRQSEYVHELNTELSSQAMDLKSLNAKLLTKTEMESYARKQADKANEAKSIFLATMSHEIRTPMNGVLGMTALLAQTSLNEVQKEYTDIIKTSGEALLALINDILDFSKIESGNLQLNLQPFDLHRFFENTLNLFHPAASMKNIRLSLEVDSRLPAMVIADELRLRQILINLVGNSLKFTDHGEVAVKVKLSQRSVLPGRSASSAASGLPATECHELIFQIMDTGIGIAREDLSKLFKEFSQLDSSVSRRYGGTGLGLAITERLIGLMGGTIYVESEPGKGSNFIFNIPVELKANSLAHGTGKLNMLDRLPVPVPKAAVKPALDLASECRLQILVAEDNVINQKVIVAFLARLGYLADLAADGLEVLSALELRSYDLIFMDVQMPELDGLETTRRIRQGRKHFPQIVAMTANAMLEDRQVCLDSGMDSYLSKPVRLEELVTCIRTSWSAIHARKQAS